MALSEEELDRLIKSHLSNKLDANIEVPDVDSQWKKIKQQIIGHQTISVKNKSFFNRKRILAAAAILISIGSITFLYPNNANAFGAKIAKFFNYVIGETTQNKTERYTQPNEQGIPEIQDVKEIIEKEVSLDQAQTAIPFKLAKPNYLPNEAKIIRVVLTSLGADVYEISIEYDVKGKVVVFSQQNSASGTSRGTLYDTEDTVIKDIEINGNPSILFMSKNGINTLNWQSRGLILQITGKITEEEIIKTAQSIN